MKRQHLLAVTTLLLPTLLFASGFQSNDLSPRLQGQAMAGGGADMGDVTAIFINPAILSTITKPELYVGASYDAPHLSMKNATAEHGLFFTNAPVYFPVTGSTSQSNVAKAQTLPAFYAALPVNRELTFGISLTSPWSYDTNYDSNSVVRYMAQKTQITSYNLSGLLSYAVDSELSFAAGIQGQYLSAQISNFDGSANGYGTNPQASEMDADNMGLGYILGALYSPSEVTHVGISYRSKIDYQLNGYGAQYTTNGAISSDTECSSANIKLRNCHTSDRMNMTTPSVLNVSLVQQLTAQWQLDFTTEATFWSEFKGININMPDASINQTSIESSWQNSVLYSIGSNYQLNSHWTLRGGVGYDATPTISNTKDARIPDNNKVLAALGATYQINQHFRVDASYEHAFMEGQHLDSTQTYSQKRGYVDPTGSASVVPVDPYQANQVSADYSGSADIVALGINYLF